MKRGFLKNKKAQKTALNPNSSSSKNDVKSSVGAVAMKLPYGKMENTGSFLFKKRKQTKKEFNPTRSAAHELHSQWVIDGRIRRKKDRPCGEYADRDHYSLPRRREAVRSRWAQRVAHIRTHKEKGPQHAGVPAARSQIPRQHQIVRGEIDANDGKGRFCHLRHLDGGDHLRRAAITRCPACAYTCDRHGSQFLHCGGLFEDRHVRKGATTRGGRWEDGSRHEKQVDGIDEQSFGRWEWNDQWNRPNEWVCGQQFVGWNCWTRGRWCIESVIL